MCAIIDANVASKAFGGRGKCTETGDLFRAWVDEGRGRLAVGGDVKRELVEEVSGFRRWLKEAVSSGRAVLVDDKKVDRRTVAILKGGLCKSDDWHVIALAQISGAHLLYTEDKNLQQDFGEKRLIDKPRGKVYSKPSHKHLFKRNDLCRKVICKGK